MRPRTWSGARASCVPVTWQTPCALRRIRPSGCWCGSRRPTSFAPTSTVDVMFDVDSDRIKPESAATIKMIASGLQSNSGSNFVIEGHTDSTGDAAHNMDLSQRRAEAVKSVLVAQFGIDGARLTTKGFGPTKPVASNNTPQGRAENRRVEFVRQ